MVNAISTPSVYLAHNDTQIVSIFEDVFTKWADFRTKFTAAGKPYLMAQNESPQPAPGSSTSLSNLFGMDYGTLWNDGPYTGPLMPELRLPWYPRGTIWGHISLDVLGDFQGTPAFGWGVQARAFGTPAQNISDVTCDAGMWSTTLQSGQITHLDRVIELVDFVQDGGVGFTVWARQFCGDDSRGSSPYNAWIPGYRDLGPAQKFTIENVRLWLEIIPRTGKLYHADRIYMSGEAEDHPYFESGQIPNSVGDSSTIIQDTDGWVTIMTTPTTSPQLTASAPCKLSGHHTLSIRADRPYIVGTVFQSQLLVDGIRVAGPWTESVGQVGGDFERQWAIDITAGPHVIATQCRVITPNSSIELANCISAGVGGLIEVVWPHNNHPRIVQH